MKKFATIALIFAALVCRGQGIADRAAKVNYNHTAGVTEYYDSEGNYLGYSKTKKGVTEYFPVENYAGPGYGRRTETRVPEIDAAVRKYYNKDGNKVSRQVFNSSMRRMEFFDSKGRLLGYSKLAQGGIDFYDNRGVKLGFEKYAPRTMQSIETGPPPSPENSFLGTAHTEYHGQDGKKESLVWDGNKKRYTIYDESGSVSGYYSWDRRKKQWKYSDE